MRKQQAQAAAPQNEDKQPVEGLPVGESEMPVVRLKTEQGHFKAEAKVCIMSLIGENEVPAHRCGPVIQNVVRQVCGEKVPDSDLPSQRSALRFADQGHVVSKSHVAQILTNSENWDLHTDGTSRSGLKYVGQQVSTEQGAFSVGFVPVAAENASTLVEVSIQMLEELSELHTAEEAQQNFVRMLLGLSVVMTDRASVMKSFGKGLQEE